jgi:predicted small lipoprotein YifL
MSLPHRTLVSLILLIFVLSACGQKGPLYLPSEDPAFKEEPASEEQQR